MRVVGEAVLFLLGVVDHKAELHALTGELAVRETAEPRHDRGEPSLVAAIHNVLARVAAKLPLRRHPGEVIDEEISGGAKILSAPFAIAIAALLEVVVARRAIAVTRTRTVEVLAPQQKLDGVIAGGDVGFDAACLLQVVGQELLG